MTPYPLCERFYDFLRRVFKTISGLLFQKRYRKLVEGLVSLFVALVGLVSLRVYVMGNKPPDFAPADNPAADNDSLLTRTLTFLYLPAFNLWLLVYPKVLSFDWSMESIPLITSLSDYRNLLTLLFYTTFVYLNLYVIDRLNKHRDCSMCQRSNGHGHYYMSINHNYRFPATYQSLHKFKKTSNNGHVNGCTAVTAPGVDIASGYSSNCSSSSSSSASTNGSILTSTSSSYVTYMSPRRRSSNKDVDIVIVSMALLVFPFIPATNLFFYVGFVIAERVLFIPSMGFCLLVALGANNLYQSAHKEDVKCAAAPRIFIALFSILVISFCVRTVKRNRDWRTEEDLYRSGISVNPPKGKLTHHVNGDLA